jgi:hypothetical protein
VVSGARYVLKLETASTAVAYIKQTEHSFFGGDKEQISYVAYRRENLKYTKHIIQMGHKCGLMQEIMDILQMQEKGPIVDV